MNKKPIKITIDNYKGKRFTFTMPELADVSMWTEAISNGAWEGMLTGVGVEASYEGGIEVKEEDLNGI